MDDCRCFHRRDAQVVTKLVGHKLGVESVGFCSSLKLAASGDSDGNIKIWDITNGSTFRRVLMCPFFSSHQV